MTEFICTPLARIYSVSFEKFNLWYNSALGYYLNRRLDLVVIVIVLFIISYSFGYKNIEFSDDMNNQRNEFEINIDFPDRYTTEERSAYIKRIEKYVEERKEELGIKSYEAHFSSWYAEFEGHFSYDRVSKFSTEEAAEEVYKNFPEVPGVRIHYRGMNGGERIYYYRNNGVRFWLWS